MVPEMLAIVVLIIGFSLMVMLFFIKKILNPRVIQSKIKIDDLVLNLIGRPLFCLIFLTTIWSALYYGTSLPELYPDIFHPRYLTTFFIFIGSWIFARFVGDFFKKYGAEIVIEQGRKDQNTLHFFRKGIIFFIWIIGFLLILSTLDINIGPLLATGGVIGLIISLGGQDVIGNFLSGIIIATDKPLRIGDRVKIANFLGDIVDIGSYSSRLKTLDNQIITVPNKMLTNDIVINYAMPNEELHVRINIGVAYGSDVRKVKEHLLNIGRKAIEIGFCLKESEPEVYFLEFANSSLNFQLIVCTDSYSRSWDVLDYINCQIDETFKAEGIEIPFPQIDVHIRNVADRIPDLNHVSSNNKK
ncbi:MAG: mechanosensitive ion channel protein MscS [Methanomicrobiales archaeon HGW-Methanomicrobiales-4]|nr:MAG: mechanosensitive ion channel protein MscS [Methanomicrobiales archaeon HGW-Methanomicrobiales-4]